MITPLAVFVVVLAIGYLVRRLLLRALEAWYTKTQSRAGRILADSLRGPMVIWIVILGVHLALQSSELPTRFTQWTVEPLRVLFVLSLTLMCMRMASELIRYSGAEIPGAFPVTTLTQTLAQLGVLIIGVLVVLNQLRISITPILTALGVGGLAVALALQDTLANLFAGFYVAVAGQVRVGDYIKMDSGSEGYVADITWRSTTIRTLGNNLIIVPNSKLAQAIVTNYHLPEKRMPVSVQVNVPYDSDPKQLERVLLEIAQAVARDMPGMLSDPAPSVSWDPGFADSSVGVSVNYSVTEFAEQFGVRNEMRKRILSRFREEGIAVPYPRRTILMRRNAVGPRDGANHGPSPARIKS
ncbi:MAG: mechanosensitive ion channel family protein [Acidobacteriia bacterium]|nr:mechanosensitive ion channel family protein [Terriglobia bacterium]